MPDDFARPAADVNPDAGDHLVAADPLAVAAVDRAGAAARAKFPYVLKRFGDRGRAFTDSDGGWLVLQAALPEPTLRSQIDWLGSVLASRGMPRVILETYLLDLAQALAETLPTRKETWSKLAAQGSRLRDDRMTRVSAACSRALAERLAHRLGPGVAPPSPDALPLLTSALADERAGIRRAVPSLLEWLADGVRFGSAVAAAVIDAVAAARTVA